MEMFSIVSGSSGNCICVGSDNYHVMIDTGLSGKRIEEGLNEYDLTTKDMDGILITHEHSDHIAGLGVVVRKCHIPIYGTHGTIEAIKASKSLGRIDKELFHEIDPKEDFSIGDLNIKAVPISHDAAEPCAYRINNGDKSVAVLTDLGVYNDDIIEAMKGLDVILLEANHDIKMLEVGPYPYPLKMRILGEHGHLSNEASGQLLSELLHDNMKHIFLGHLSNENNYPDLAYETVKSEISLGKSPYKGSDFPIEVALRHKISSKVEI